MTFARPSGIRVNHHDHRLLSVVVVRHEQNIVRGGGDDNRTCRLHGGIEQPLSRKATTDRTVDLDRVGEAGRQIHERRADIVAEDRRRIKNDGIISFLQRDLTGRRGEGRVDCEDVVGDVEAISKS